MTKKMTIILIGGFILIFVCYCWKSSDMIIRENRFHSKVDPKIYDLKYEKVEFRSSDGYKLIGWFIPSSQNLATILVLHGWGCDKGTHLSEVIFLQQAGFNLFLFDTRGHGESQGNYTSLGWYEVRDVKGALDYLKTRKEVDINRIGAIGFSMGATTAFLAQAQIKEIKAVVGDSGFLSLESGVTSYAKARFRAPKYPFIFLACWIAGLRLGFNFKDFDLSYYMDKISPRAVFIIHGEKDEEIRVKDAYLLYKKAKEPKKLWIVEGAFHLEAYNVAPKEYQEKVVNFFKQFL